MSNIRAGVAAAKLLADAREHLRVCMEGVRPEDDDEVVKLLRQRCHFLAAEEWINERNRLRHR